MISKLISILLAVVTQVQVIVLVTMVMMNDITESKSRQFFHILQALQMKILKDVGFGTKPCKINLFHLQSFLL
jgi:hypothetical protein